MDRRIAIGIAALALTLAGRCLAAGRAYSVAVARTSASNLLAYYRFETNLIDTVGNRFPLAGQGNPGYQAGKLGQILSLTNAASQYARNLVFTNADQVRAIDCWINFASTSATPRYAFTLSDGDTENMLALDQINADLRYRLSLPASQIWSLSATNLATGIWHHVVATCGSNGAALYVNGALIGMSASTATPLGTMTQLLVGAKTGPPSSFDGGIDNLALFSVQHSSNVVQYSYNGGKGIDFLAEKIGGTISYAGLQTGTVYVVANAGAAGIWTNMLSSTGAYEFAQLVPYTNYNITAWRDYTANGQKDPWEAQRAYAGNPVGLFTSNVPNADITLTNPVFSVSGTATYSGGQTGLVHAIVSVDPEGTQILSRTIFPILSGTFTITNVPGGGPFHVRAFMDYNGNGTNENWEACSAWSNNPVAITGNVTGISVPLVDLDSDYDGMPDWWEMLYFGDFSRDGTGDLDDEGLLDGQEHDLGTSPLLQDTDGDGQSDWAESIAGTGGTDELDFFSIKGISPAIELLDPLVLYWDTVSGRTYRLLYGLSMTGDWAAATQVLEAPGDGQRKSFTNESSGRNGFFRLTVEKP